MGRITDEYPRGIDAKGREIMDDTPAAPTVRREKAQSLADTMRGVVRQMQYEASMAQEESEDDARDFDVEEDSFPKSPHELFQESPEYEILLEDLERFGKARRERLAKQAERPEKPVKGKKEKAAPEDDSGTE